MAGMLFMAANLTAMVLWAALILARFFKPLRRVVDPAAGYVAPALFAVGYLVLVVAFIGRAEGDMGSLAGVAAMFSLPEMLLAGWLHYIAFDLFVGGWIARTGDAEGVSPWLLAPILAATLIFGPIGFLAFVVVRLVRGRRAATVAS
ncbi:MAG: DUF4281 domain-containing protein [Caulobacteraceae bacterium]|nr:MAG: DUF4281 domain-containing protein [Caulobacteraceae bacterium]